jgi:hypothetical protein
MVQERAHKYMHLLNNSRGMYLSLLGAELGDLVVDVGAGLRVLENAREEALEGKKDKRSNN